MGRFNRNSEGWKSILDEMAGIAVKCRDGFACRKCGKRHLPVIDGDEIKFGHDLQWAHVVPKVRGKMIRWIPLDVAVTLCFRCHDFYDKRCTPAEKAAFAEAIGYGAERIEEVVRRGRLNSKYDSVLKDDWIAFEVLKALLIEQLMKHTDYFDESTINAVIARFQKGADKQTEKRNKELLRG